MAIFEWKPQYAIGIPELDEQHQVLVGLINEIDELLARDFDLPTAQALFRQLVDYTVYHFAAEERLMVKHQYDEASYQAHLHQHRQFEEEIAGVLTSIDDITPTDCAVVLSYLTNWLINHICKVDHKLGEFVLAQKRKREPPDASPIANNPGTSPHTHTHQLTRQAREFCITLQTHRQWVLEKTATLPASSTPASTADPDQQVIRHTCGTLLGDLEQVRSELLGLLDLLQEAPGTDTPDTTQDH